MEANREEAARCLLLGRKALEAGDLARARRLGARSISLFATEEAQAFLSSLDSAQEKASGASSATDAKSGTGASSTARQRKKRTSSRSRSPPKKSKDWTPEQEEIVKTVNAKSPLAFYEILDLPRNATDADIKKAYRKLALKLHPDKNSAPKADEAFKKVSKAFSILSDPDKRRTFDASGADPDTRGGGMGASNFPRGFAGGSDHPFANAFAGGEFDAEEIFRAFFGNGMNSGFTFHTAGFGAPQMGQRHRHRYHVFEQEPHEQHDQQAQLSGLQILKGFLSMLIPLVLMLLLSPASTPDFPRFAFTKTRSLDHEFRTSPLSVPFFANSVTVRNFKSRHQKHMSAFFQHVEATYEDVLESGCKQERATRDRLRSQARGFGILSPDEELLRKAEAMKLHTCDLQKDFYNKKAKKNRNNQWF